MMWKRFCNKSKRGGFTLLEMMAVVGIIVVLCGVAIFAAVSAHKTMKLKEYDDYAKTIFLVAQSHLAEMRANGTLDQLQGENVYCKSAVATWSEFPDEKWAEEYRWTSSQFKDLDELKDNDDWINSYDLILPEKSVEATLRNAWVLIEYNPLNGNVFSVFYCPANSLDGDDSLLKEYWEGRIHRDEDFRKKNGIGYYCGSGLPNQDLEPEQSVAQMQFTNGEEGILNIDIAIPDSLRGSNTGFVDGLDVKLILTGETTGNVMELNIMSSEGEDLATTTRELGDVLRIHYVLDSLADYSSFANLAAGNAGENVSLTTFVDERMFDFRLGENLTIQAEVTYNGNDAAVDIHAGILAGVNPLFDYLMPGSTPGLYVLAVSNGRNLQNLNVLAPSLADAVELVVFSDDVYWNQTVSYYNNVYATGGVYSNAADEAPARALPYFVPIHNELLLGTAWFNDTSLHYIHEVYGEDERIVTRDYADVVGNGNMVVGLNIDSTRYAIPAQGHYYVTNGYVNAAGQKIGGKPVVHYNFTGLFAYANTNISDLNVVNSFIKGLNFDYDLHKTTATGSLVGVAGPNALLTNCGAYIVNDAALVNGYYDYTAMGSPKAYQASGVQDWYGVSGEGAVGGLVGYSMSARVAAGDLTENPENLAFIRCFAAVPVSGNMRGNGSQNYGYTNGVGGLVGVGNLSNFMSCYASGDVLASGVYVSGKTSAWPVLDLDGKVSAGVGGLVGTSHGSRFSNCFATGNVTGNAALGAGGFVGVMCYDGGFNYYCDSFHLPLKQFTVFESCYCVGEVTNSGGKTENFAGGMASDNAESYVTTDSKLYTDYYLMYAPYWDAQGIGMMESPGNVAVPDLNQVTGGFFYIYKDCYYLDRSLNDDFVLPNKSDCGSACGYSHFMNMLANHGREDTLWILNQVVAMGNCTNENGQSYQSAYLNKYWGLYVSYYKQLARGYDKAYWIDATEAITHPYSFTGGKYLFPLTSGMEYYGDWPTFPLSGGLAYYEYYSSSSQIRVQFDREDTGNLATAQNLRDWGAYVTADGYAVVTSGGGAVKVELGGKTFDLSGVSTVGWNYGEKNVTLYPLTQQVMDEAAAQTKDSFYVRMTITAGGSTYVVYFNPNVANSQINPIMVNATDHTSPSAPAGMPGQIQIRTARQLAALSTMDRFWNSACRYIQVLDINGSMYNGNCAMAGGIGNAATPFMGSYVGVGGQMGISGMKAGTSGGIFGVIGTTGVVKDVKVTANTATADSGSAEYVGIVADVNHGTMENVDLSVTGSLTVKASKGAGLLVGFSDGSLRNCDVHAAVGVKLVAENMGAVVGVLEGDASNCTVGLDGCQAEGTYAGGFAGKTSNANVSNVQITMEGGFTGKHFAGGFGGNLEGGKYSNITVTFNGDSIYGATAGFAGIADRASNAKLEGLSVTLKGTMQADGLSGLVNTMDNSSMTDSTVDISGIMDGTSIASGAVGTAYNNSTIATTVVTLSGTIRSDSGFATGFAQNVGGICTGSEVRLNGGTVTGRCAVGFTQSVTGEVSGYCAVTGTGTVNGTEQSAGFALNVSGLVAAARVTPATQQSAGAYWGLSNDRLAVTGGSVAGFVFKVGERGSVLNCDALCSLDGTAASGFVDSNLGSIEGCIANVTLTGGHAFVRQNEGTVSSCYGWYGDGEQTNTTVVTRQGLKSCYFVDIDIVEKDSPSVKNVDVIDYNGNATKMYLSDLPSALGKLNGSTMGKWQIPGAYAGYPYSQIASYPFPMLREHCGDWSSAQAHFFGVIYFEEYEDSVYKLHVVELSTAKEGQASSSFYWNNGTRQADSCFDATGTIVKAGYLLFCKDGSDPFGGNLIGSPYTDAKTIQNLVNEMAGSDAYRIYNLNTTEKFAFYSLGQTVEVVPCFADAIGMTDTYQIRTPYQLSNIHTMQANYIQTRDITLSGDFNALGVNAPVGGLNLDVGQTYDGNGFTIDAVNAKNAWIRILGGTLKDLTLIVGTPESELIRTVNSGGVVSGLKLVLQEPMTARNAVIGSAYGNVQISSVKINSKQFRGLLVKDMPGGTLQVDSIEATVADASVGTLFGNIAGGVVRGTSVDLSNATLEDFLFESLTGGTRLEGFQINIKRMNRSLIGRLVGSVSGVGVEVKDAYIGADGGILAAEVKLGEDAVGNLIIMDIQNCVFDITNVHATGDSFGVICMALPHAGNVKECTVNVATLNTTGRNVGGLVAVNQGNMLDNTVNIKIAAQDSSIVGGMAGNNSGTLSSNQVNVTIRYTQTQEEKANAIIGGLVGQADGGTLYANGDVVSVTGSIVLVSERVNTGKRNYIIGGVVGKDNGTSRVFYTSVKANVAIDSKWADASDVPGDVHDIGGRGPIGMFVGYINNGFFTNCGNAASNALYQFGGQIKKSVLRANGRDWFKHADRNGSVTSFAMSDGDTLKDVAQAHGYTAVADGQEFSKFIIWLDRCTFVLNGQKYQQVFTEEFYLYSGSVESNQETGESVAEFRYRYDVGKFEYVPVA